MVPSVQPSLQPTSEPTSQPTSQPTLEPTIQPTFPTLVGCPSSSGPLIIPTTTVSIAANAYYLCGNITSVVVPSTVTVIGDNIKNL